MLSGGAAFEQFRWHSIATPGVMLAEVALGAIGERISCRVADAAALSILAITLTQLVLNRQRMRDRDDRRRDIAMHAKLDESLRSETYARKELAGIENWRLRRLPL